MGNVDIKLEPWIFVLLVILQIVLFVINYGFDLQMPLWALLFPSIVLVALVAIVVFIFVILVIIG